MDFDQAIVAHAKRKEKLGDCLAKRGCSLKPAEIGMDTRCPLGQWIHGEASHYVKLPEYSTLRLEHARFHKAAAEFVRRAHSGESASAGMELGSQSEFGKASSAVIKAIMAMKNVAR